MAAEKYLMKLEACPLLLDQVERTPPPEVSNFYWKNDDEEKYKVFIPTPNRKLYYNLEEYEGDININEIDNDGWKSADKCVLLAVSNSYAADQLFIDHMDFLIANLSAWNERNTEHWIDVGYDLEYENRYMNKHYIINEYLVDDIKNIPMEIRGTCAKFKGTITINPDHDVAGVIHAMNIGFQLAAKRFARDRNHQVYAYGRRGFSY
ncbi:uncharacterized protein LOC111028265 isoform X1 [Myzus persicae]|uniref:uncharacterized protein LOC111028265 isoform X1 n=1 Tax=Myzus persicae TaxID=13164 RepID=UPI000B9353F7|nr:uncharacterized protein LOC111028265 isoform X1 [Myzus persicae]